MIILISVLYEMIILSSVTSETIILMRVTSLTSETIILISITSETIILFLVTSELIILCVCRFNCAIIKMRQHWKERYPDVLINTYTDVLRNFLVYCHSFIFLKMQETNRYPASKKLHLIISSFYQLLDMLMSETGNLTH